MWSVIWTHKQQNTPKGGEEHRHKQDQSITFSITFSHFVMLTLFFPEKPKAPDPEKQLDDGWQSLDAAIESTKNTFLSQLQDLVGQIEFLLEEADRRFQFVEESKERRKFHVHCERLQGRQRSLNRAKKCISVVFEGITANDAETSLRSAPPSPRIDFGGGSGDIFVEKCLCYVDTSVAQIKAQFMAEMERIQHGIDSLLAGADVMRDTELAEVESAKKRRFYVKLEVLCQRQNAINSAKSTCLSAFDGMVYG